MRALEIFSKEATLCTQDNCIYLSQLTMEKGCLHISKRFNDVNISRI